MGRESINENVKRKLYAETMGRCMNPDCRRELFRSNGDIVEKAHIIPYRQTADNSYENLIVLCPNCHTDYDKNRAFTSEEMIEWKKIRKNELEKFFDEKYNTFDELRNKVTPLLLENKTIYENYYLKDNKELWDKCEGRVLANNRKLKGLLEHNVDLIQNHSEKSYSNLECIYAYIAHINEFEMTRMTVDKNREILFPKEINSMFGITPVQESILPSTESLEKLITRLKEQDNFVNVVIGTDKSYIQLKQAGESSKVFLDDTPRLRQLYFNYKCFTRTNVRLDSLLFALKYMKQQKVDFQFIKYNNLREIIAQGVHMIFVYEYCLSEVRLLQLSPEQKSVIVNLHNWNGDCCISKGAYELSREMNVTLLTMKGYYEYIKEHKRE